MSDSDTESSDSTMDDLRETLEDYVIENQIDLLQDVLQNEGIDINMSIVKDYNRDDFSKGTTLLMLAVRYNRPEIVELLIQMGCNIEAQDRPGRTAVMNACRTPHIHLLQRLIDAHSNLNHIDREGSTVLQFAVRAGYAENVRALFAAKGINTDGANQTPQSRAELNQLDHQGHSLLMHAAASHRCTPELIHLLVNAGCDVNQVAEDGFTALLCATQHYSKESVLQALISHGADVNAVNSQGETPLMQASRSPNTDSVRLLLDQGADVHARDQDQRTALHHCCSRHPESDVVQMLLEAGSDVNSRDKDGKTPLMHALSKEYSFQQRVVGLLLDAGADVNAVDNNRCTPIMFAALSSTTGSAIPQLLNAGGGATINNKNAGGTSALHFALRRGQVRVVRALLSAQNIKIDMRKCRRAASDCIFFRDHAEECLREVAATLIQRQWRECDSNPTYLVCHKRLMEEGTAMERDVKRLKRSGSGGSGGSD